MNELPTRPTKVILKAQEAEAWINGYAMLERVKQRASEADQEARQIRARAYAEGFEEGRRAGETQAAELLANTTLQVDGYLAGLEPSMAELCLKMVRRILGQFDDTDLIVRCVQQALIEYRHDMTVTIRVAPQRVEEVEARLGSAGHNMYEHPTYRVEGDAQLGPGQCLLVSPVAIVDVGLEAQLNALHEALKPSSGDTE